MPGQPFKFAELFPLREQIEQMQPLEPYQARDRASLTFRRYATDSNIHLILIHGSSGHSAYLHGFARQLSDSNVANVYLPDLRGHGLSPHRRGDIGYIGQLEDDLADLITCIKTEAGENARFLVGGHSSGGGLALRFAGSRYGHLAEGYLLLAPYLGHDAPMVKRGAGGWASANIPKIIALSLLNALGIKRFNGTKVLRFNLPEEYRTGHETLEYSFRMMKGLHPDNYRQSLKNTQSPLLILVGSDDEAFHAEGFNNGILPYKADAEIGFIPDGLHLGILLSQSAMGRAATWIRSLM